MVKIDGLGQKVGIASFVGAVGLLTVLAKKIISAVKENSEPVIPNEKVKEKPSNALFYAERSSGEYFFITDDEIRTGDVFRS